MKLKTFHPAALLLAVLLFTFMDRAVRAELPPVIVPAESQIVTDDANLVLKKGLDKRYEVLLLQFNKWNADAIAFNDKYGGKNLDADTKEAKDGQVEQARLSKALEDYERDADQFKNIVGRLRLKEPASSVESEGVLPKARVVAHGDFYIVTKDGRKLTGAEAVTIPLDGGTRVVTGSDGGLQMLLPDETVLTLGPNSDLVLDDFVYDHNNHSLTKAGAQIMKGSFRWVTGKLSQGHDHDVKIKIPIGDLGFRGTDFEAMVASSGAGYVKLFEGQLDITEKKTGKKIELNAKRMINFTADGTISQPVPLNP